MIAKIVAAQSLNHEVRTVAALHQHFQMHESPDVPTDPQPGLMDERAQCLMEEVKEFMEAIAVEDMAGMADALVDLVYFAKGTAAILGLPWRALFEDVHRANMAKVRGVGKRGFAVDLIKPEGWEGPKTMEILKHFGYEEKK